MQNLQYIAQLVESIPSPLFYKDEHGRYLGCNKAFETFIGTPRDAVIGKSVFELSPPELASRYHAADQALFDHPGTQTYEAQVRGADGHDRDVIFYKGTFEHADGRLGGLVGVILDISERKQMEARIRQEAYFDALTGLPNRRLFEDRLAQVFKHARRSGERFALLFIDLDRFKEVNDTLGHRIGDLLLVEAGRRIERCLRESDTAARWSGDEFIVVLADVADAQAVTAVASDIIDTLAEPYRLETHLAPITASVGMAVFQGREGY